MLSRKKTKNEVSKPAEVQGKYVKKETSPLLRMYLGMINLLLSHTSHSKLKEISPFWYLQIHIILQKFLTGFRFMLEPL
ncbi:hypothetical protein CB1_002050007 [Camelus ferus]|nr:hypothetical protein CB1_002050007 [Camelus ferus]